MRETKIINDAWEFSKDNSAWEKVNLPHTWNGVDGQDGGNDYYRGKCYYKKQIDAEDMPGEKLFVKFYGVNSSAEVFFNGTKCAAHDGGYSAFEAELNAKKGELVVAVDNSANDSVYPQQADFTFYGGIYRNVELISLGKVHFVDEFHITPVVKGECAEIELEAFTNDDADIEYEIINDGEVIYRSSNSKTVIENPHLWNGRIDPHLYTANAYASVNGQVVDKVSARFGIRSFEFDPDKGFILNGKEYPLRGVSTHQDRPQIGNALLPEHHKEDMDLICEMGATTIRLAHYQHDQYFYDLCDERGMVVWAEIPYISRDYAVHLLNILKNIGFSIYKIGKPRELTYNAKVDNYNFGVVAGSGLNLIAALKEKGIDVEVKAIAKLMKFEKMERL